MKPSEILRRAARRVERGMNDCGCDAIGRAASGGVSCDPPERVMEWFRQVGPRNPDPREPWWGRFGEWPDYRETFVQPNNVNARIIGLCLAAAIAESEGQ